MAPTHYEVLGIDRTASADEVRIAFKRKALETHPDKLDMYSSEMERQVAASKFRRVREAFEVLSDVHKRRAYDLTLYVPPQRNRHSMFVGDVEEANIRLMAERQAWTRSLGERSDARERERARVAEAKAKLAEMMAKDAARSPRRDRRSQIEMDEYANMFVEVLRETFERERKANMAESSQQWAEQGR